MKTRHQVVMLAQFNIGWGLGNVVDKVVFESDTEEECVSLINGVFEAIKKDPDPVESAKTVSYIIRKVWTNK